MIFIKFIERIYFISLGLIVFVSLLILAIYMEIILTNNLSSEDVFHFVLIHALEAYSTVFTSAFILFSILLVCTSAEAVYSSLISPAIIVEVVPTEIAEVIPAIIDEVIPTEREEWKGIMSELKYGWKILGMTEEQIRRQEILLSISLVWGKLKSWMKSVWNWILFFH
jgi:hypothetical protein